jgi:hypothetical protein
MRFFEGVRPEVFLYAVKLKRDKKTGKRKWQFTLIVTMNVSLVESCDVPIAKAWEYLTDAASGAFDVYLKPVLENQTVAFFNQVDDVDAQVRLSGIDLGGLRMTKTGEAAELWFTGEHENNSRLHTFMKEYAYTRCWAAVGPRRAELEQMQQEEREKLAHDPEFLAAADRLASTVRTGGVESLTLSSPGMEPVVIDKAAAERIHEKATRAKRKPKPRDPG